jgi:hypothetical protein
VIVRNSQARRCSNDIDAARRGARFARSLTTIEQMAELLVVETLLRIVTEAFVVSSAVELTTSTDVVRQLADSVAVVVERGLTNNFVRANFARSPHTRLTPPHKRLPAPHTA